MSNPAPGALATVRAVVNSRDIDEGTDELAHPAARPRALPRRARSARRRGLHARDRRGPAPRDRAARGAARAPARASRRAAGPGRRPQRAPCGAPLTLRFTGPDSTGLEPAAGGVDGALGRLLAIIDAATRDGTWQRLKA